MSDTVTHGSRTATSLPSRTGSEHGITAPPHIWVGSPVLQANLQRVLVDLVELGLQGKQAHWNLVGPGFRALHLHLDEIVADVREFADVVAERLRSVGAPADGRSDTVVATTRLSAFPSGEQATRAVGELITTRLREAASTIRIVHGAVDAEDPASGDILLASLQGLELHAWMLGSEFRSAEAS